MRHLEFGASKAANLVRIPDKSEIGVDDRHVPKVLEAWTKLCNGTPGIAGKRRSAGNPATSDPWVAIGRPPASGRRFRLQA
jgi:hypothetical protein